MHGTSLNERPPCAGRVGDSCPVPFCGEIGSVSVGDDPIGMPSATQTRLQPSGEPAEMDSITVFAVGSLTRG